MTTAKCPICHRVKALVKDHCHETGEQREPICATCNAGLGMFYDSPTALRAAARYIQKHRKLNEEQRIQRHWKPSQLVERW